LRRRLGSGRRASGEGKLIFSSKPLSWKSLFSFLTGSNGLAFQQFGITHTKTIGGGIAPLQLVNAT
jgi:hypothetical protein